MNIVTLNFLACKFTFRAANGPLKDVIYGITAPENFLCLILSASLSPYVGHMQADQQIPEIKTLKFNIRRRLNIVLRGESICNFQL